MISMSGAFSVTFSVIFAYVADVTDERERSTAYGLVSCRYGNIPCLRRQPMSLVSNRT